MKVYKLTIQFICDVQTEFMDLKFITFCNLLLRTPEPFCSDVFPNNLFNSFLVIHVPPSFLSLSPLYCCSLPLHIYYILCIIRGVKGTHIVYSSRSTVTCVKKKNTVNSRSTDSASSVK